MEKTWGGGLEIRGSQKQATKKLQGRWCINETGKSPGIKSHKLLGKVTKGRGAKLPLRRGGWTV